MTTNIPIEVPDLPELSERRFLLGPLIKIPEACRRLGLDRAAVLALVRDGVLTAFREPPGPAVYIELADVQSYIRKREIERSSEES